MSTDPDTTPEQAPPPEVEAADTPPSVADWLLAATESRDRSRLEWQRHGVTMLQTGRVFCAIRLSARLVRAAAGTDDTDAVDDYLARALVGGPVIHDPYRCRYYALVSAGSGRAWEATRDLEFFGVGGYVGVPRPGRDAAGGGSASYWSVPMKAAGALCAPSVVAALVEIGRYRLAGQAPAADSAVSPLPGKGRR